MMEHFVKTVNYQLLIVTLLIINQEIVFLNLPYLSTESGISEIAYLSFQQLNWKTKWKTFIDIFSSLVYSCKVFCLYV